MAYESLSSTGGLFYNFAIVKMKGPNKLFEIEYINTYAIFYHLKPGTQMLIVFLDREIAQVLNF